MHVWTVWESKLFLGNAPAMPSAALTPGARAHYPQDPWYNSATPWSQRRSGTGRRAPSWTNSRSPPGCWKGWMGQEAWDGESMAPPSILGATNITIIPNSHWCGNGGNDPIQNYVQHHPINLHSLRSAPVRISSWGFP